MITWDNAPEEKDDGFDYIKQNKIYRDWEPASPSPIRLASPSLPTTGEPRHAGRRGPWVTKRAP
ncbi:hypothetical protein ACFQ0B_49170 [Nonomuraea thailandensis]